MGASGKSSKLALVRRAVLRSVRRKLPKKARQRYSNKTYLLLALKKPWLAEKLAWRIENRKTINGMIDPTMQLYLHFIDVVGELTPKEKKPVLEAVERLFSIKSVLSKKARFRNQNLFFNSLTRAFMQKAVRLDSRIGKMCIELFRMLQKHSKPDWLYRKSVETLPAFFNQVKQKFEQRSASFTLGPYYFSAKGGSTGSLYVTRKPDASFQILVHEPHDKK